MIRRWHVEPDMEVQTADGIVLAVSIDAQIAAVVDACVMSNRAGGGFSVWYDRFPTGLPGEMVTTGAIVEWRDRTDAKPAAERQTGTPQVAEPPPEDDPSNYHGGEYAGPPTAPLETPYAGDDIGDGLDPATLEAEDESALEEAL